MVSNKGELITLQQVINEFDEIIKDRPDFIYHPPRLATVCQYVHEDEITGKAACGCVVGHWLHRYHYVSLTRLAACETITAAILVEKLGLKLTDRAKLFVKHLQRRQDQGDPWRDAFIEAQALADSITSPSTEEIHS